jgi:integrase
LRDYCRALAPDNGGISEKREVRLQQFDDSENLIKLLLLPQQVYQKVARKQRIAGAEAIAMQIAVAIELLLMKPMRIRSLAEINAETQITRTRPGRDGITHIAMANDQVKNNVGFSLPLPECSAELLRFYLERGLPLLSHGTPWLFPGTEGNHKRPNALGGQIQRFIKKHTGLTVNPHLFRSIAAIIILNRNPGAYEDVAQVLGTKTISIIIKHYCREETKAALKRYEEIILELRGQPNPRKGR